MGQGDETLGLDVTAGAPSAMKFYMVGDRYDKDCRPLLELLRLHGSGSGPSIGTCRIFAGKYADGGHPPKVGEPSTTYVCDTLAQCAHLLTSPSAWASVAEIKGGGPTLLLREVNDEILCERISPRGRDVPLDTIFQDLAQAWGDGYLAGERSVGSVLQKIVRDIADCGPTAQEALFGKVQELFDGWWQERKATLCAGALSMLSALNRRRKDLHGDAVYSQPGSFGGMTDTLCSHILACLRIPRLAVGRRDIERSLIGPTRRVPAANIVYATPYCRESKRVMRALLINPEAGLIRDAVRWWLP